MAMARLQPMLMLHCIALLYRDLSVCAVFFVCFLPLCYRYIAPERLFLYSGFIYCGSVLFHNVFSLLSTEVCDVSCVNTESKYSTPLMAQLAQSLHSMDEQHSDVTAQELHIFRALQTRLG